MCAAIAHRGPDDAGFYEADQASLAMRRLAIVDLHTGGQPMANEDQTVWVVFNGEIYNHRELRRKLIERGHHFCTSHADTETVVHGYEEYGLHWPERLRANGMFGLAVWETGPGRLTLYRDRMGKKPLYYAQAGQNLVFASEIKALLRHPDVSREPDPAALYLYFGLKNISAPATAYNQIRQLLPGHCLIWQSGVVTVQPWWRPDFSPLDGMTDVEAAAEVRRLLEDAVRLRMDCDAPYGAYLSGGVDSSAVATLMARFQSQPLKTFCLGYADAPEGQFVGKAQDIHHARTVSRALGTQHHEYILIAEEFARSMPEVVAAFDEPFSGTVSTFFLSILMHRHVKVALSGDGADELFGSYLAHRLALPMQAWLALQATPERDPDCIPEALRRALRPFDNPEGLAYMHRLAHVRQAVWRDRLAVFGRQEREALLQPEFLDASGRPDDPYQRIEAELTAQDALNRVLETDQAELLANQVLPFVDRLSMAHSIEVRCPFLDHRLVELVNRLPGPLKMPDGRAKHILKLAVADLLPAELINRPKEGFVQPIYAWMYGPLRQWTLDRLAELPADIVRSEYAAWLGTEMTNGNSSVNAKVWNLVCFSLWHGQAANG